VKKSELKYLKLKVKAINLRKYDEYFYCMKHQQYVTLAMCHYRATVLVAQHVCYDVCKNCPVRKQSFHVIHRPRMIVRKPRKK